MPSPKKQNRQRIKRSSEMTALPAEVDYPTREAIEQRAYEIYLARGGEHGYDLEDWVQAERELREQPAKTRSE